MRFEGDGADRHLRLNVEKLRKYQVWEDAVNDFNTDTAE